LVRTNLIYIIVGLRIKFGSNWSRDIRFGKSAKGHLLNVSIAIDPSAFKGIGIRNYWVNNNLEK
jgi:hypothetical protein